MPSHPSELTDAQLKELKQALVTKLAGLTSEIRELESELTESENDEKGAPDEVDRSSFEEEMQRMQLVLDGKNRLKLEVAEAIKRFDDNSYGVCEETEEPIGFKRLRAQPWTRFSIEAQQELEERSKNRGGFGNGSAFPSGFDSATQGGSEPSDEEG
jgi:DnaK suppressor protein